MKPLILLIFAVFLFACSDQVVEVQLNNLAEYNMKIIPEKPSSNDKIKLVVYDDCTYNKLSGVTQTGRNIDIEKRFNGMMKWPCVIQNDTIEIGKLTSGNYHVNYKLVDIAKPPGITVQSLSFELVVNK